ncbi:MAG TPA: TOBE domain-containing protein [Firmicutes bacterium]|nr:TOBE domain-containing protein [Bacillota bacterium]
MKISGRNKLQGRVVEVKKDGLMAEVTMDVTPGRVTAVITSAAADELALAAGDTATALIKATSVMITK